MAQPDRILHVRSYYGQNNALDQLFRDRSVNRGSTVLCFLIKFCLCREYFHSMLRICKLLNFLTILLVMLSSVHSLGVGIFARGGNNASVPPHTPPPPPHPDEPEFGQYFRGGGIPGHPPLLNETLVNGIKNHAHIGGAALTDRDHDQCGRGFLFRYSAIPYSAFYRLPYIAVLLYAVLVPPSGSYDHHQHLWN